MAKDAFGNDLPGDAAATTSPVAGVGIGVPDRARTPRFPSGIPTAVLGLLLVVLSSAGTAWVLVDRERENRDDPVQAAVRGEVGTLDPRSLLLAGNLARAAAVLEADLSPDEVVLDVTVSPAGLGVSVRDARERRRTLTVDLADRVRSRAGGEDDRSGPRLRDVPLPAIERAVRGVLARTRPGARVVGVRATVGAATGDRPRVREWTLEVEGVRIAARTWYASADGARVRLPSDPSELTREPS